MNFEENWLEEFEKNEFLFDKHVSVSFMFKRGNLLNNILSTWLIHPFMKVMRDTGAKSRLVFWKLVSVFRSKPHNTVKHFKSILCNCVIVKAVV